jgi:hypothetical protein
MTSSQAHKLYWLPLLLLASTSTAIFCFLSFLNPATPSVVFYETSSDRQHPLLVFGYFVAVRGAEKYSVSATAAERVSVQGSKEFLQGYQRISRNAIACGCFAVNQETARYRVAAHRPVNAYQNAELLTNW